jgi:hypothetical protein
MKKFYLFIFVLSVLSGCNSSGFDTEYETPIDVGYDYNVSQRSPLAHGLTPIIFENQSLAEKNDLEAEVKRRIHQALPRQSVDVYVDNYRIIVSVENPENEGLPQKVRESIHELSKNKNVMVVTEEELFHLYRNLHVDDQIQ